MIAPPWPSPAWIAAAVAGGLAAVAGIADRQRARRRDVDRIGWVDWRTVQMAALIGLAVSVAAALAR